MKTIIMATNVRGVKNVKSHAWYFLADSALSNAGKPFFIPENETEAEALLAPVIKINRLGKTIAARFGSRYYSEIAPAIHFRLPSLRQELANEGLPTDMSYSFDRSLIVGSFMPFRPDRRMIMTLNNSEKNIWEPNEAPLSIDDTIASISSVNTMKMGDLIAPILCEGIKVEIGDTLEVVSDGEPILSVKIK